MEDIRRKKNILVADDDEWGVRELIASLKEKYNVEYVSDGKQVIERIEKESLDGVVLDFDMPPIGMNEREAEQYYGNNVAKRARQLQPSLVIILRSSIATNFSRELTPFDVYCHTKNIYHMEGDAPVLEYFYRKFS